MSEFNHSSYSGEFGDLASDNAQADATGQPVTNASGVVTLPTVTVTAAAGLPLPIMIGGGILAGGLLFWLMNREG